LGGTGVNASIGVGGGGMAGCYGFRDGGGRKKATARWGGSSGSESAVEAALAWLHRHQEPDGHWDAKKWEGTRKTDPGVTGLALLAFLGAGYTEREGRYKNTVAKATQWIVKQQGADGLIGKGFEGSEEGDVGYNHSICGLALAEAYGMGKNASARTAAQKAVDYSINTHQCKGSGWRYTAGMEADLSVTGWFIMQLKSAKIAGLNVPNSGFQGAVTFCDTVSDQYGRCRYKADWLTPNHTMTSVGMLVRLYTGSRPDDPKVNGGANYLLKSLPVWGENGNGVNMYYWYYGTMTMFQVGGEPWKKWNFALRDMLCDNQRVGGPKDGSAEDVDGSWDPVGAWATRGGRVYSTAVGALCLEVYYRYLPLYRQ
ncbi:MAG: prenyltransferase/squalene oxidase repeat-containing protein, partial [Planctomycetota bacterium]